MAQQCQVRNLARFRHSEVTGMTERLREGISRHSRHRHGDAERSEVAS